MDEKKTYIIEQVGQMYMRHGIRSVTMDDVANELGVSKKTLYQYFKDKAGLVEEVVSCCLTHDEKFHEKYDESLNAIDRVLSIREHIFEMLKLYHNNMEYDLKKSYPYIFEKITKYKKERIYKDSISIMEQGKGEGLFRSEIDNDIIAKITVGRFLYLFNPDYQIFDNSEINSKEFFDKIMDYHFHGICTETGIQYFKQQLNNVQNEN